MNEMRPTSIRRVRPSRRMRAAARLCDGISSVRLKSPPVPLGMIPSSASLPEDRIPFATSEIVPSPPQAMISLVPLRAASAASDAASPRTFVNAVWNGPNSARRSLAARGHASPVAPLAEDGLTITSGSDIHAPVLFAKLGNLFHDRVGDLFVRAESI